MCFECQGFEPLCDPRPHEFMCLNSVSSSPVCGYCDSNILGWHIVQRYRSPVLCCLWRRVWTASKSNGCNCKHSLTKESNWVKIDCKYMGQSNLNLVHMLYKASSSPIREIFEVKTCLKINIKFHGEAFAQIHWTYFIILRNYINAKRHHVLNHASVARLILTPKSISCTNT